MLDNRRFFNWTAGAYDFITRQDVWRAQIGKTLQFVDLDTEIRRVLDLGCGPGISSFVIAEKLPRAQVVGIDVSDEMIARARRHHSRTYSHCKNIVFRRADVYDMPSLGATFDLAIGHSFLYLLPDRTRALEAIFEQLRDSGRLVVLEPHAEASLINALRQMPLSPLFESPLATMRFALSMTTWRLVSASRGPMARPQLQTLFRDAGFHDVVVQPTLAGLGLHGTGLRPPG